MKIFRSATLSFLIGSIGLAGLSTKQAHAQLMPSPQAVQTALSTFVQSSVSIIPHSIVNQGNGYATYAYKIGSLTGTKTVPLLNIKNAMQQIASQNVQISNQTSDGTTAHFTLTGNVDNQVGAQCNITTSDGTPNPLVQQIQCN